MIAKNKITKLISAFLIISILLPNVLFSKPQPVEAQGQVPVLDAAAAKILGTIAGNASSLNLTSLKDWAVYICKELLKVAAKRLLAKMTQATINWINSDFHGAPLFLENPESFFRDIAKSEIRNLVDMIGYDTFRFPFGKQTALNVISSYKSQLETNAQYSLSKVINDPDLLVRYRNDFNYGGWNGFLINTQYPQNNYLGFQMIIQQNLASRLQGTLQAPAEKVQSLLQQGMGFLSPQSCPSNPAYNNGTNEFQRPSYKSIPYTNYEVEPTYNPNVGSEEYIAEHGDGRPTPTNQAEIDMARERWNADNALYKADWERTNTCPGGLQATTPGSVAANQIFNALDTPRESTTLAGALGNSVVDSVGAIFDALINHFLDKGLTALASTVSSSSGGDNWSYNGQTLDGSTPSGTPTALNIPQNVSVTVGQTASTTISGGTAPYSIQTQPNISVATARIDFTGSGNPTLTVTGITPGQTFVTVQDSSTPSKTVAVQIAINAIGALVINPHNILTNTNDTVVATISGGQEPYFIQTPPNQAVAIVSLSSTGLIVSGIGAGQTSVVVRDSSTPVKTTIAQITTNGTVNLVVPDVSVAEIGRASRR